MFPRFFPLLSGLSFFCLFTPSAKAEVIRVPEDYLSIGEAIDAASACDTVHVGPGTWNENVWLKQGVDLEGEGDDVTFLRADSGEVLHAGGGNEVRNLGILGGGAAIGIYSSVDWVRLLSVMVDDTSVGIQVSGGSVAVVDSILSRGASQGIRLDSGAVQVEGSSLVGNGTGIQVNSAWLKLKDSSLEGNGVGISAASATLWVEGSDFIGNLFGTSLLSTEGEILGCSFVGNDTALALTDSDLPITANLFRDNSLGLTLASGLPVIVGNVFFDNAGAGLLLAALASPRVENNAFVEHEGEALLVLYADPELRNNSFLGNGLGAEIRGSSGSLYNNLFVGNGIGLSVAGEAPSTGWNLYHGNTADFEDSWYSPTDITLDPLLNGWSPDGDPENDDYTPEAGSPAVDAGDPDVAQVDPDGSRNDIGWSGGPGAGTTYIPIENEAPSLIFYAPSTAQEGAFYLISNDLGADPDGDLILARWDYLLDDELEFCDFFTTANAQYFFPDQGTYTVRVQVMDPIGAMQQYQEDIPVENDEPQISASGLATAFEGYPWVLDLNFWDPGVYDETTARVDWEDDGVYDEEDVEIGYHSHDFPDEGSYSVRVQAQDGDGGEAATTVGVEVYNISPQILSHPPELPAEVGRPWEYLPAAWDPGMEDVLFWFLNSGPEGMEMEGDGHLLWTPASGQEGEHAVAITVEDGDSGLASQTFNVAVEPASSGDDDSTPCDDDTTSGDDDATSGDDDTGASDDDTPPMDDDTAPEDDDTFPDDDDSPPDDDLIDDDGPGGCSSCDAAGDGEDSGWMGALMLMVLPLRRRRLRG